jgi:hypothetical protein
MLLWCQCYPHEKIFCVVNNTVTSPELICIEIIVLEFKWQKLLNVE